MRTRRRELEAQLYQSQEIELAAQLGSGLAHDLNNILSVLRGQLELLADDVPPNAATDARLEAVHHAIDRASSVASGLLTLGRRPDYAPERLDLNELVSTVASLTQELLGDRIELEVQLEAADAIVRADPLQMEQVLLSLVTNARDAMPRGGRLTLRTRRVELAPHHRGEVQRGASVAIDIIDTGVGMDAGTQAQVFTPYFTTKPPGSGTGLGLSQALQVVRRARGTIDVRSEPGRGSTFTVILPLVHEVAASDELAAVEAEPGDATVLVVDDDPGVLEVVAETLERAGLRVLRASSAALASELFASSEVDLVITDLVMPEESGLSLATRLRSTHPWLPVIVMSAHFDETIDRSAIGPSLEKPFSAATLLRTVQASLSGLSGSVDEPG